MGAPDASEDVDQFLARIASLSKKSNDDAEQARKSEEQMMQARRERQARRAERARSISPVKTGPAAPLSSPSTPGRERSIEPPVSLTPGSRAQTLKRPDESPTRSSRPLSSPAQEADRPLPQAPRERPESPSFPLSNANALSRSGTLSWQQRQQRPLSRGIGSVRSRPLSSSRGTSVEPPSSPGQSPEKDAGDGPARKDIAAALGSKDPTWFRQTPDRGIGSAAYRKSEQNDSPSFTHQQQGMKLPGLSSDSGLTHAAAKMPPPPSPRSTEDEQVAKHSSGSRSPRRNTAAAYISNSGPVPSLPPTEPTLSLQPTPSARSSQDLETGLDRTPSTLGPAGRPPSPTKGLGGFVQSAMMRRSDSVSKRWSVRADPGLKRGDSVAGNRPVLNTPASGVPPLGHARTLSREPRNLRDGTASPQSGSRPTSSHADDLSQPSLQKSKSEPHGLGAPLSNTMSNASQPTTAEAQEESLLSRSPSKTMDPRRWSPTKASWLESALARPESPRFSPTKEELPPWKVGLQRSKSQKDLGDVEMKRTSFDPVNTGGFLRSSAPGLKAKPVEPSGKPSGYSKSTHDVPYMDKSAAVRDEDHAAEKAKPSDMASQPLSKQSKSSVEDPVEQSVTRKTDTSKLSEGPDVRSNVNKQPPALKPKPQTPPKTDFRTSLKSRQTGSNNTNTDEPEFKSMFGKLKKAETKNYVAPDVLKANITYGKAALNLTGGPQPRKRVDEFKESILARKDEMKAGGGSIHKKSASRDVPQEKAASEVPEALRRRNTLHKSNSSVDNPTSSGPSLSRSVQSKAPGTNAALFTTETREDEIATRTAVISPKTAAAKPALDPVSRRSTMGDEDTSANRSPPPKPEPIISKKSEIPPEPEQPLTRIPTETPETKPSQLRGPDQVLSRTTTDASDASSRSLPLSGRGSPAIGGGSQPKKAAVGVLAARLNPALAGLIARASSPKTVAGEDFPEPQPLGANNASRSSTPKTKAEDPAEDPAELTHMTKGRARGPKRRAPKVDTPSSDEHTRKQSTTADLPATSSSETTASKPAERSPTKTSFADARRAFDLTGSPKKEEAVIPKEHKPHNKVRDARAQTKSPPAVQAKSPEIRNVSNQSPSLGAKVVSPPAVASKSPEVRRITSQSSAQSENIEATPPKPPTKKPFDIAIDGTSRNSTAPKPAAPMPLTPSRSKLNSPRVQKPSDELTASPLAGKSQAPGLGLLLDASATALPRKQLLSPPSEKALGTDTHAEVRKVSDSPSSARRALEKYFATVPRADEKADFDTEAILKVSLAQPERVKTLNCQAFEVMGNGQKNALSPGQEHVLYEDCMYLVIHNFEQAGKKATEAYLWTGDAVSSSALEDAQLFCRKVARENSAKLDVIKQGKESSTFFSAVGGILITRRSQISALYMLCGQRHAGHVAFDEVELSPEELCSGFPYLISAKFGKLYLWKGQGCGADEVGAARLIGMDIGLTGEIEEVAEGREPAAFWECFPGSNAKSFFRPSEIWAMRSMDEKKGFPCKLYQLELERPKSSGGFWGLRATSPSKPSNKATLTEVTPFTQQNLEKDRVYVLDAWASIYIIPGSQSKPADFVTAVHIAQELAVLTPSMQDRALLPSCEVVFGSLPRDARAAFRKFVPAKDGQKSEVFDVAEVLGALD